MARRPLYETSVIIDQFKGMNQAGDGYNMNMRYARELENVNVRGGSFQQMREGKKLAQEIETPISTLAFLHRRYGTNRGTVLVAISDGKVYTKTLDGSDDWVQRYSGLTVYDCDWLAYEVNTYPAYSATRAYAVGDRCVNDGGRYKCNTAIASPGETWNSAHWTAISSADTVDILLFTNAADGMFCMYGDDLSVVKVATPKKFGVITQYNERIWGSGITDEPDMLAYSVPFDPFDWSPNLDNPEDGAGDVLLPTWDGDRFVALRQFGSDLLAFKRNSVWRVYGANPGEFVIRQQYGGGTIVENTVCVFVDSIFMLGEHGMMRYDGNTVTAFLQEQLHTLMQEDVNRAYMSKATAGMRDGVYCLALPTHGSTFNNAVMEFDARENTLALRTGLSVASFMQMDERLFYTSATSPGCVFEMRDDVGMPLPVKWVSGFQDIGLKNSIKSAFVLYMMVEAETPVELRVGIRTEKKYKQKIFNVKPGKATRLHLNTHGRYYQLVIESYTAVPFSISGGVRLDLELDPD